jgi:membrane protease YdiL (CAAX protease family)
MLMVVVPILVLTKLSGADLKSIFIKRGDLWMGLGIGALVFVFLGTASFMFAVTRFSSTKLLGDAVVWGLVFSIANGFMEELWLRGIFLKRLAPLLGVGGSVLPTALVFGLMHGFAFYFDPIALIFYMLNTVALGLACGYLMMKSDSIWGRDGDPCRFRLFPVYRGAGECITGRGTSHEIHNTIVTTCHNSFERL